MADANRPFTAATSITYAQGRAQLAARLDDPEKTFFTDAELGRYLLESLQTYNAYAAIWRGRIVAMPLTADQPFYDLNDIATDFCARDTTDQTVITAILDRVMETAINWTAAAPAWTGTDMFTLDAITAIIQARIAMFQLATGMVIAVHPDVAVPSASIGRVPLPEATIDVRRCAWVPVDDTLAPINLWKESEFVFDAFATGWATTPDTPFAFSIVGPPPLSIQLAPPPIDIGTLHLLALDNSPTLMPTTTATLLPIPNDFIWVIQFGVLADLLGQDGQAKDPARQQYCLTRWEEGCSLARAAVSVLHADINGSQVPIGAVMDLDQFSPTWQGESGAPTQIAMAGYTTLAVAPVPDATAPYSLTLDVVRNAPLPAEDTDILQVAREAWDAILLYAQHLAAFKQGAYELQATLPHKQSLLQLALAQNSRLRADSLFIAGVTDQNQRERRRRPSGDPDSALPVGISEPDGASA